jgi:hypothetical protein
MSSREQSLAIPMAIREQVLERDGGVCRLCGRTNVIAHHIRYGGDEIGMGGRRFHSVDNIVSLGQYYEHQCHEEVHSAKGLWTPLLIRVVEMPGVTALALYRWIAQCVPVDMDLDAAIVEAIRSDQAQRLARGKPGPAAVPSYGQNRANAERRGRSL